MTLLAAALAITLPYYITPLLGLAIPPLTAFITKAEASRGIKQVLALLGSVGLAIIVEMQGDFEIGRLFLTALATAVVTFKSYDWGWAKVRVNEWLAPRFGLGADFDLFSFIDNTGGK